MADTEVLITSANERADKILGMARDVTSGLRDMASWDSWTRWTIPAPPAAPNLPLAVPITAAPPTAPPPAQLPPAVQFDQIAPLELGAAPDVDSNGPPTLEIGAAPVLNLPEADTFIGQPPQPASVAAPQAPALATPQMGNLANVTIPPVPVLSLPTLDAVPPAEEFLPLQPKTIADFHNFATPTGSLWASQNLSTIEEKLRSDIATGGTGIAPDVQQAIFNKAIERDAMTARDVQRMAVQNVAKRGFPMPPGLLLAQQNDLSAKMAATRAETSRTIMATTAEMAQKNAHFAITGLTQVEQMQVQFSISFADRMLSVARASIEAAIALFNASLLKYNARLDAYRTRVQAFELLLRAEAQKLDIFKGQIEGAKLTGELNMQQVEIYKARLAALQTMAEIYKTQVDAYAAQLGADRAKLDVYRVRAEVYQSRVQAEAAKLQAFDAQVRGETAKVQAYQASVQADEARVRAYVAGVDAKTKQFDAKVAVARAQTDVYAAQVTAVRAQNEQQSTLYGNQLVAYKAFLDLGIAENHTRSTYAQIYNEAYRAQVEVWRARGMIALEEAKHSANHMVQNAHVRIAAYNGMTNAYSSMASGAMSAVNAVAQTVTNK